MEYDHVAVLCTATNTVVDTIAAGVEPSCVAVSPDGDRLYVADYAGTVTVLSVTPRTSGSTPSSSRWRSWPRPRFSNWSRRRFNAGDPRARVVAHRSGQSVYPRVSWINWSVWRRRRNTLRCNCAPTNTEVARALQDRPVRVRLTGSIVECPDR
jgi:hypothetical protein